MNLDTKILPATDVRLHRDAICRAAGLLRQGGLVVFPTETVYGIGANALDEAAVAGIFAAKGRPQDNPLIAHIARLEQLERLASFVPASAYKLAKAFWPGPLTMVLPRSQQVPDIVSAGLDTVAVRMPSHPIAQAVIEASGVPVAAPSANRSGRPSPTTGQHCVEDLMGRVNMILDGGPCTVGVESTVVSLAGETPRLLRPGAVTQEQLREVLGSVEADAAVTTRIDEHTPVSSPGMKYKHYAPKAKVVMVEGELSSFSNYLKQHSGPHTWALAFDEDLELLPVPAMGYGPACDDTAQARNLFGALRFLDQLGAKTVYARAPRRDGVGLAVYNRLIRAAGFTQVNLSSQTT